MIKYFQILYQFLFNFFLHKMTFFFQEDFEAQQNTKTRSFERRIFFDLSLEH